MLFPFCNRAALELIIEQAAGFIQHEIDQAAGCLGLWFMKRGIALLLRDRRVQALLVAACGSIFSLGVMTGYWLRSMMNH